MPAYKPCNKPVNGFFCFNIFIVLPENTSEISQHKRVKPFTTNLYLLKLLSLSIGNFLKSIHVLFALFLYCFLSRLSPLIKVGYNLFVYLNKTFSFIKFSNKTHNPKIVLNLSISATFIK